MISFNFLDIVFLTFVCLTAISFMFFSNKGWFINLFIKRSSRKIYKIFRRVYNYNGGNVDIKSLKNSVYFSALAFFWLYIVLFLIMPIFGDQLIKLYIFDKGYDKNFVFSLYIIILIISSIPSIILLIFSIKRYIKAYSKCWTRVS